MNHMRDHGSTARYAFHAWAEESGELGPVYEMLGQIIELTQLDRETVMVRIGCTDERLRAPRDDAEANDAGQHSLAYMAWLIDLAHQVDTIADHREVMERCFTMSAGAGGPIAGRVVRCKAAFEASNTDEWPAFEFLRLGEIERAFVTATRHLPDDAPAREDAAVLDRLVTPFEGSRPHLSAERVAALVLQDAPSVLGVRAVAAMEQHLRGGCSVCRTAFPDAAAALSARGMLGQVA